MESGSRTGSTVTPVVSFIIPAYNEGRTIATVVERVRALPFAKQLVVVDDGSTDDTATVLDGLAGDDLVIVRKENGGKGSAVIAGIGHVTGSIVVIQDADLEYDPKDVPELIAPIVDGVADVVYGSRLSGGRPQRAYLFWHLVGNRFLSLVAGVLYNTTLSDMETGYKAFRADVLRGLKLSESGFGIEPEITGRICRERLRIYELPISYYGRTYDEGKKITWRDGVRALWVLVRVRVS
ncbi:MAG TPA: glycosyltransferase family 2 protein [Gaiellaceae bacterium]|nr:glycosyltransferase family 2 protein [Gaiellaceae bacterium]